MAKFNYVKHSEAAVGGEILFENFQRGMRIRVEDMPKTRMGPATPGEWDVVYTGTILKVTSKQVSMSITRDAMGKLLKPPETRNFSEVSFVSYDTTKRRVIFLGYE